jgi:hypothetical protein
MEKIDTIIEKLIDEKLNEKDVKLAQRVENKISAEFMKKIQEDIEKVKKVEITLNGVVLEGTDGLRHKSFDEILKYIAANISTILVGPAGSGKTQIAVQCAEALGRTHYSISVNEHTSKTDFMGYMDANGKIVKTNFRTAFEEGGVFIIDEIDAANPNILTIINSALSNGFCPFPDGMVARHNDFLCLCTANTFGEGESVHYIGRNILDAATKDRFATVFVDYDSEIEKALTDETVFDLATQLRKYFKDNSIDFIISTRGMMRLASLCRIEGYIATKQDIRNCLNLHTAPAGIDSIISKFA